MLPYKFPVGGEPVLCSQIEKFWFSRSQIFSEYKKKKTKKRVIMNFLLCTVTRLVLGRYLIKIVFRDVSTN